MIILDTLVNVLYSVQQKHKLTSESNCPIPITTNVVLDHIEINVTAKTLLIFCKITDDLWMVENMVSWKGYTIIAHYRLPKHIGDDSGTYTFSGVGKVSILEKHVRVVAFYTDYFIARKFNG